MFNQIINRKRLQSVMKLGLVKPIVLLEIVALAVCFTNLFVSGAVQAASAKVISPSESVDAMTLVTPLADAELSASMDARLMLQTGGCVSGGTLAWNTSLTGYSGCRVYNLYYSQWRDGIIEVFGANGASGFNVRVARASGGDVQSFYTGSDYGGWYFSDVAGNYLVYVTTSAPRYRITVYQDYPQSTLGSSLVWGQYRYGGSRTRYPFYFSATRSACIYVGTGSASAEIYVYSTNGLIIRRTIAYQNPVACFTAPAGNYIALVRGHNGLQSHSIVIRQQ